MSEGLNLMPLEPGNASGQSESGSLSSSKDSVCGAMELSSYT
jgi:hypothetical protein